MRVILAVSVEGAVYEKNLCCALWDDGKIGPARFDKCKQMYYETRVWSEEDEQKYSIIQELLVKRIHEAGLLHKVWNVDPQGISILDGLSNEQIATMLKEARA